MHRRSDELRLECVLNAVARLGACWALDVTTTSRQSQSYSSVRRRVDFKMATPVYLSLSGMAPAYLAADCQLVSDEGCRQLRSAPSRTCVVRRTYSNYGDRCFAAAGPKLWNSLPAEL